MSAEKLEQVQDVLGSFPEDKKMLGREFEVLGYDFYKNAYKVKFTWEGKAATFLFPAERFQELESNSNFAWRRLRNEVRKAFKIDEGNDD